VGYLLYWIFADSSVQQLHFYFKLGDSQLHSFWALDGIQNWQRVFPNKWATGETQELGNRYNPGTRQQVQPRN